MTTANSNLTSVNPIMPSFSRSFPKTCEHLLVLRSVMRQYKINQGRVLTSGEWPESDADGAGYQRMYALCICPHIVGHGVVVNGIPSVCESVYADLDRSQIAIMVRNAKMNGIKWVVTNEEGVSDIMSPPSRMMATASEVYRTMGPLTVYNTHAVSEAKYHSMGSPFWKSLYADLETIDCEYGIAGLIHNNTVLSIGSSAGEDYEPNLDERVPKKEHMAFLDSCYTPSSKASGKVRCLVMGTSVRLMTRRTLQMAYEIISAASVIHPIGVRDWVMRCMGYCCMVSEKDVCRMVNKWKEYSEINMPTIHVFRNSKVVVVSVSTGVVIRPIRTRVVAQRFVNEGPFVDSMIVHGCDTLTYASLSFPDSVREPEQYFNAAVLCISFGAWTADPRLNLGVQIMRQAMSLDPIKGDATITALGSTEPLLTTSVLDAITSQFPDGQRYSTPGRNVVVAFINRYLNSEEACSVSRGWATSGATAWSGYINYPLPNNVGFVKKGMRLMDQDWWKPGIEGTIIDVRMSQTANPYVVVQVGSKTLEIGDKIANGHGLKFTVGELVEDKDMPEILDERTNETFKPNILLSTKNLTRGLGGTIREMATATSLFDSIGSFRAMHRPTGKRVFSFDDEKNVEAKLLNGPVMMNGTMLKVREGNGSTRTIRASYGIMRVVQLRHLAALKHHYPSTIFSSLTVPRGRFRQGTPRVGEGELLAMMMQDMTANVRDCANSSDAVYVTTCSHCNRLIINCDCSHPKPEPTTVMARYPVVMLDMYTTLATMNCPDGKAMSLRYITRT